jgi:hypothetical protein
MSTAPKPFVFVLMPFDSSFDDVYKFGIKDAANEVGAYAERLDEQIFSEGMLDRIFNQIGKADVIVADMTGRNPNVFYEVGYAHALNKVVVLLTRDAGDIPFDLTHRQHIVYEGSIQQLRTDLVQRLRWAMGEVERANTLHSQLSFSLRVLGTDIPQWDARLGHHNPPTVGGMVSDQTFALDMALRNEAPEESGSISHVYVFAQPDGSIFPCERPQLSGFSNVLVTQSHADNELQSFGARADDSPDGLSLQYRLPVTFPSMPPGAVEQRTMYCKITSDELGEFSSRFRLRIHCGTVSYDYPFTLSVARVEKPKTRVGSLVIG